jgi:hypothetical protein
MHFRVLIAAAWGMLIGGLTFAAGPIAWLSGHAVIAAIQTVLTYLMLPGLIVAAGVGSLGPAAVVNALIHFGLCFIALRFLLPSRKSRCMISFGSQRQKIACFQLLLLNKRACFPLPKFRRAGPARGSGAAQTSPLSTTRPKYRFAPTNSSDSPATIGRDCALDAQIGIGYSLSVDSRYIEHRPYFAQTKTRSLAAGRCGKGGFACQPRDLGGA